MNLDVTTPERVAVELPLAGVGSRAAAYLIDVSALLLTALVLYFLYSLADADPFNTVQSMGTWARVGTIVGLFFALFIYWTLSEVLLNGQTLGKRVLKIRVVRLDGSPVTTFDSAVRNLIRLIDFLPALYTAATVSMLVDGKHRRLGDLAAGTVVIREDVIDLSKYEAVTPIAKQELTATELDVIASFLERAPQLDLDARLSLGRQLAGRIGTPADQVATMTDLQLLEVLRTRLGKPVSGG